MSHSIYIVKGEKIKQMIKEYAFKMRECISEKYIINFIFHNYEHDALK